MDDVFIALPWYSDPEVLRYSEAREESYDLETVKRMYAYLIGNGEMYIIEVREETMWAPVGDACLMKDSIPIVIGVQKYRSRGLGRRVLGLLIERAGSLGWNELKVKGIYSYNERSLRLFSSFGFTETARMERSDGIVEIAMRLQLE